MILTLTPTDGDTLTVVNDGAATGYELLQGAVFGSPVWEHQFSGARGTQGGRPAQGTLPNRQVSLPVRVAGSSKDDLAAKVSALAATVDELRRHGGTCRMRSKSQTYAQRFEVLAASSSLPDWNNRLEHRLMAVVVVELVCGPYVMGDPMDVTDGFDTDSKADYVADAGALGNVSIASGVMQGSANLTTENRYIHTATGYSYGDHEATVLVVPGSTITSFKAGVVLKRIDDENYLAVYVDDNGTNSRLRIDKVEGGSTTNLESTNLGTRIANGVRFWVRGRIEGNVVFAEHFASTNVPLPHTSPTTSDEEVLSTSDAAVFGAAVEGTAGIVFTPQHASARIEEFEILPFTYRSPGVAVVDCAGEIPGDAPAIADARVGYISALGTNPWATMAWSPRPDPQNFILNGDFEYYVTASPWAATAVSGVVGAGTSITRTDDGTLGAGAKFGEYVAQVICPATANTGAHYPMYRRFRRGTTYTGRLWVRASSGTTNVRIRLGVSGDIQSSTAAALSTTWTEHTVTWTPTADVDLAYLAVEVTAATATTFQIDGASVYEGTTQPTLTRHREGMGGVPPLAVFNAEGAVISTSNLTITTDATANGGSSLVDSSVSVSGEFYSLSFPLDVDLVPGDDYARGSVAVEVFARVMVAATFTSGVVATVLAANAAGSSSWGAEGGAEGLTMVAVSGNDKWRLTRVGTLNLTPGRWTVSVEFDIEAGTNAQDFRIDDIYLLPARSRWMMPTGKAGSSDVYPTFLSAASWRLVRSDLSSLVRKGSHDSAAGGVLGSLIELPAGRVSVLALTSSVVPDDPVVASASEEQGSPPLHLGVTPRWHWMRTTT